MLIPNSPEIGWTLVVVGALFLYWAYVLWKRDYAIDGSAPIIHEYHNCVVHQYPDGTSKAESKPEKVFNELAPTETSVAIAIPSLEILSSYNVDAVTDNGTGEYTIHFDNPISGYYTTNVSSDKNVEFEISQEAADCANIKLTGELPNTLNIEFKKIRE